MKHSSDPSPELAALLRLKRHEQPPAEYFDEFVHAFHERQRAELLRVSAWGLFADRVGTTLLEWRFLLQPRWLVPAGAACTLLLTSLVFRQAAPAAPGAVAEAAPSSAPVRPVAVLPLPGSTVRPGLPWGAMPVSTNAPSSPASSPNGLRRTPGDALVPVLPSTTEGQPLQANHGKIIILVR